MPALFNKVTGNKKPEWLKIKLNTNADFADVARIVESNALNTICSSGMCPNRSECWARRTATFMVMGDVCTRSCRFCATKSGKPLPLQSSEPDRVAASVGLMGLSYVVVTSVTRDDLPDGGAEHWAEVVRAIREQNPQTKIELLIPDMGGDLSLVDTILDAGADVTGHNIECAERITSAVRSRADYQTSLRVLEHIASSGAVAKSGIMVGIGESDDEVIETLADLRKAGVSIVTIGQYLRPTLSHLPVERYVEPEKFEQYKEQALAMGFAYVESAPLVRSSYMAHRALEACTKQDSRG